MQLEQKDFKTFETLEVYKHAREFRKEMYEVARKLPDIEKFALANQVRRAAVSLTNNIAEGHGRWHYLDHIKFLLQARGSLQELLDDLNVCHDEGYLQPDEISSRRNQGWLVLKIMNGYLRYLRDRKVGRSLELREETIPYGDTDEQLEQWLSTLPLDHN